MLPLTCHLCLAQLIPCNNFSNHFFCNNYNSCPCSLISPYPLNIKLVNQSIKHIYCPIKLSGSLFTFSTFNSGRFPTTEICKWSQKGISFARSSIYQSNKFVRLPLNYSSYISDFISKILNLTSFL